MSSWQPTPTYGSTSKRPFFRQGSFYGGLLVGAILLPLLLVAASLVSAHNAPAKQNPPITSGNITISLSDQMLATGMRLALARAQDQIPFTITNVTATSTAGNHLALSADGPSLLNVVPTSLRMTFAPTIDKTNHLDFVVLDSQITVGLGVPLDAFNDMVRGLLNDQFTDLSQGHVAKGLDYELLDCHTVDGALVVTAKLFVPGTN